MCIDVCSVLGLQHFEQAVCPLNALTHELFRPFDTLEISGANSAATEFVLVRRTNAATGRADLLATLTCRIEELVVWKHEVRAIRDDKSIAKLHAALLEMRDLGQESFGIENHTITDHATRFGLENASGYLMQNEFFVAAHNGMSGVRTALIAYDEIGPLGEDVDNFPLPFVTPLGTDYDYAATIGVEHRLDGKD